MTDAEMRLRSWMRDYGHTSQRPFVADLEGLLTEVKRLRAQKVGLFSAETPDAGIEPAPPGCDPSMLPLHHSSQPYPLSPPLLLSPSGPS